MRFLSGELPARLLKEAQLWVSEEQGWELRHQSKTPCGRCSCCAAKPGVKDAPGRWCLQSRDQGRGRSVYRFGRSALSLVAAGIQSAPFGYAGLNSVDVADLKPFPLQQHLRLPNLVPVEIQGAGCGADGLLALSGLRLVRLRLTCC